ncbi:hypothetical protein SAMN05443246_0659 [Paenibacillus sp. GP183]|nr:hypothetical protein SAMN05443246_0659 [Paenibacillus sp. GP183]
MDKQYYIQRLGQNPEPIEKRELIKLFLNIHHEFFNKGQQYDIYCCTDNRYTIQTLVQ